VDRESFEIRSLRDGGGGIVFGGASAIDDVTAYPDRRAPARRKYFLGRMTILVRFCGCTERSTITIAGGASLPLLQDLISDVASTCEHAKYEHVAAPKRK
jgi:hypothetical protein